MLFKAISFFFSPISRIFSPYLDGVADLFSAQKAQRITIKSIFVFIVVSTLIGFAFLSYITFYYAYVPKIAHSKPIHLQYYHNRPIYSKIDFTESGLYTNFLSADQAYDVSIELDVPESSQNIDLGNFMIHLELKSGNNETVRSSSRPCILIYKSKLLRVTSTIWRMIPLLLGFTKEDQKLKVVLFENFIEDGNKPVTHAYLTIPDKNPEIYNAEIKLDAHFTGLRYLMYYHYVSTGSVFILLFIFWEIFFSIFSWKVIVSQWQTSSLSSPLKTMKYGRKGDYNGVDNNNNNNNSNNNNIDGGGGVRGRRRQETDNVKWTGDRLNNRTDTLRNHHLDDDDDDGSETASNNDALSNNRSDDESVTESMNPTNTDYDESGFETTGEGNNYNTTTDNSNNNTDVETTPRGRLTRLSPNNDEDNDD